MIRKVGAITALILLLVGCSHTGTQGAATTPAETVIFWHDDQRNVGCWIYAVSYRGGISCLPDAEYTK